MIYKQLDGLRFFTVMAVLFHHICVYPVFLLYFPLGSFGVNVFFVISGFLITEILIREKIKNTAPLSIFKTFFTRRVLRIFPLYYFYIFICFLVVPDITKDFIGWMSTYTVNIWITKNNALAFWYFTHLWSLCLEEQFYIFWPFLVVFFPVRRLKYLFSGMIVLAIVYRAFNTHFIVGYNLFNYTMLPTTLDCFGAGALLAYIKIFNPEKLTRILKHYYIIPGAVLLTVLNYTFGSSIMQESFNRALTAVIAFYLVGLCVTDMFGRSIAAVLENRVIMYIGKISYGIYIYHLMIWGECGSYFTQLWNYAGLEAWPRESYTRMFFEFCFIALCSSIAAALSYELMEKWFLKLKKYFRYSGAKAEPMPGTQTA